MKFKDKLKQLSGSWYFLLIIIFVYIITSIFSRQIYLESLIFFNNIIFKIVPIFVLVFVLMTLSNYFITPKIIIKHLKSKGLKKWVFVIIGGILSSGPIYMWYPLLADLKNKGLSYGLIACFLYNRAVKIPLLPLIMFYFNWQYVLVLTITMIIASIFQGVLLNKLIDKKI
jgi:uncharacterized membrane protein YraQ (UPF0718 family)